MSLFFRVRAFDVKGLFVVVFGRDLVILDSSVVKTARGSKALGAEWRH